MMILVTGNKNVGKKQLAKSIEARLFSDGKIVYFLGIGNILYGVDADLKSQEGDGNRAEHLRRLGEVANVMLDAGMILVVTAVAITDDDLEVIKGAVDTDSINVVWVGDEPTDVKYDLLAGGADSVDEDVESVKKMLADKGVIFRI